MNSFRKCMIALKTFEAIKYFRRLAYVNIHCSFVDLTEKFCQEPSLFAQPAIFLYFTKRKHFRNYVF